MTEKDFKMCRICLTTNKDNYISDSSSYAKLFIQVTGLKDSDKRLWLCMWCKATLKRAAALFRLAIQSEKYLDEVSTGVPNNKRIYTLDYIHNKHIDIPPLPTKDVEELNPLVITSLEENPIKEIKIELKDNTEKKNRIKLDSNELENVTEEVNTTDDSIFETNLEKIKKNKRQMNLKELNFEVEYLNLEEQLKKVEMKREKFKDFKFQCVDCGLGFLTNDVFENHRIRHSEVRGPHKCKICALRFKSQDVLSQHKLAHKRRFKCGLCSGTFQRWAHCIAHRYKCGGVVQPSACGECFKIFNNEHSLKIHMKIHKRDNKYSCEQCGKSFAIKQRLTVHMRSHSGIKPFACTHCGRCFTTHSNFRSHLAIHSNETNHSNHYCVECNTYYKTAKSLKRHFNQSARHITSNSQMFSCKECPKQFPSEKLLKNHMNAGHSKKYRCGHCDKTFSNNSNLNKHIKCIHTAK